MAVASILRKVVGRCELGCEGVCPRLLVEAVRDRRRDLTPRFRRRVEAVLEVLWRLPARPRRFVWDILYGKESRPTTSCLAAAQQLIDVKGVRWKELTPREIAALKDLRFMHNPTKGELVDAAHEDGYIDEETARELLASDALSEVVDNLMTYFVMTDDDFKGWLKERRFTI